MKKTYTQRQHLWEFLKTHGFVIIPAYWSNTWYKGKKFTSELGRVCRKMKEEGLFIRTMTYHGFAKFTVSKYGRKALGKKYN